MQPTIPALVNDLAPDHLRGRYNALSSGGVPAGRDRRAADRRLADRPRPRVASTSRCWSSGCAAVIWVALVLERRLPEGTNGVAPERADESVSA